jgi:lipopolysaccharide cholinephosphotransferase
MNIKKYYFIISIILTIISVFYVYCLNNSIENYANTRLKYASPHTIKTLYSIMNTIDVLFKQNNILYWVEGGTYLGAIRHGGIIPWDDDIDISIMENNSDKILSLFDIFSRHGLTLMQTWFGFKIFPKDGEDIKGYQWKYPAVDIFVMKNINNKICYKSSRAQKLFGHCSFNSNEISSITRLKFGTNKVNGVVKKYSKSYLDGCYGQDWPDYAYKSYDHQNEKSIKKIKILLTDEEKQPA